MGGRMIGFMSDTINFFFLNLNNLYSQTVFSKITFGSWFIINAILAFLITVSLKVMDPFSSLLELVTSLSEYGF